MYVPAMDRMRRAVLLLAAVIVVACGGSSDDAAPVEDDQDVTAPGADPSDCPVRDHLAAEFNGRTRPGVAPPVDYAFLEARRGGCHPVRYNPCAPIPYVVNAALAPPGAVDDLHQAFRKVEEATGMTFVHEGPTDEEPEVSRQLAQPRRYGNRWAPILVAFGHGDRHRMEPTNPAGGQSFQVEGVYVTGVLIVNVDAVARDHNRTHPATGFGEGTTWGRVFIHELGHIVGLGHVARSDQIMFPELGVQSGRAEFHAGDLAGLRLLGRDAGCLETPAYGGPVR